MEYGKDAKNLGIAFAEAMVSGKKLDAIKLLRNLGYDVRADGTAVIGLHTAKEFFEGVESIVVKSSHKKELNLYKAFRNAGFSVSEALRSMEIAMGAIT